jgi:hypothetical protein
MEGVVFMNAGFEAVRPFARMLAREVTQADEAKRASAERIGTTTGVGRGEHMADEKPADMMPW